MNVEKLSFVSIDFETMTAEHTSACAVGLVKVVDGIIQQKFYSLIKPIPDDRTKTNTFVHGITEEMVKDAPTWGELWGKVEHFFKEGTVVCHNASVDCDVLLKLNAYYGIECGPFNIQDTYAITHQSLDEACTCLMIPLGDHHDPLCDATACAELYLRWKGVTVVHHHYEKITDSFKEARALSSETKKPLSADDVECKDTPFFQKKVVITGVFSSYPVREDLASLLKKYGADINGSVSAKTDIVIAGDGAGPSKLKKIQDLQSSGNPIQLWNETRLLDTLEEYNMK